MAGIKCAVCGERWPDELGWYCKRCHELLGRIRDERQSAYQNDCETIAREHLFPSTPSDAEAFAVRVDMDWHFTEIAAAVRARAGLWSGSDTIIFVLPGISRLADTQIEMLGKTLDAHVERGTEPNSLYITGLKPKGGDHT